MSWVTAVVLHARCDGPGPDGTGCARLYRDAPGTLAAAFSSQYAAEGRTELLACLDPGAVQTGPGLPEWLFCADRHLCPPCRAAVGGHTLATARADRIAAPSQDVGGSR